MREILFRAKRLDNGKWVEGWIVPVSHNTYLKGFEIINSEGINYDEFDNYVPSYSSEVVDPETVGQFTGLLDKNGKKIFEGDIVVHEVQKGILFNKGVINWDAKNARWAHQLNTMNPCLCMFDSSSHEVIGNIHDNPELLEAQS